MQGVWTMKPVRHRRSARTLRPKTIVPEPPTNRTYGYIAPAEPVGVPRGITTQTVACAGCNEKEPKPKLKVEYMGAYHAACYREMVAEWPT